MASDTLEYSYKPSLWTRWVVWNWGWLSHRIWIVRNAIKNVWRYRRALCKAVPWDGQCLDLFIYDHLKSLEPILRDGHHMGCEKDAHNIRICLHLLKRRMDDVHLFRDDIRGDRVTELEMQDSKLLFSILGKHLDRWWD